jgi:hypothetical protein
MQLEDLIGKFLVNGSTADKQAAGSVPASSSTAGKR